MKNLSQSYRALPVILWDHTMLPATDTGERVFACHKGLDQYSIKLPWTDRRDERLSRPSCWFFIYRGGLGASTHGHGGTGATARPRPKSHGSTVRPSSSSS